MRLKKSVKIFLYFLLLLNVILILYCLTKRETVYYDEYGLLPKNTFAIEKNDDFDIFNNRVYIIGDSRMYLLERRGKAIDIPVNFSFIASPGKKIDWLKSYVIPILREKLNNRNNNYKYHVVLNMGVNDLDSYGDPLIYAENYYNVYRSLAEDYPDVMFYALSVNPINDKIINIYLNQTRTTQKLIDFNNYMEKRIEYDHLFGVRNIVYCDSYSAFDYNTRDGLHYDIDTDQKIVKFIANDCVIY